MATWSERFVSEVAEGLASAADPERAGPMRKYMRDQFEFLGVLAPVQQQVMRHALTVAGRPGDESEVVVTVDALWARSGREHRYAGCEVVRRFAPKASPGFVEHIGRWIADEPWWDTCDALARRGAGEVVRRHPELRSTMNQWLLGDNLWLTRAAILHMGGWKEAIDRDWVFAACLERSDHPDFFIRKAIGWILRDLAWVDPAAVQKFVNGPGAILSSLSKREALKNIKPAARST